MGVFGKDGRIVVVGAGAVGGVVAALVSEVGYHVEIVCKYSDLVDRIKADGIPCLACRFSMKH